MAKFEGKKIIMGAISIIIGLVLLPVMAGFKTAVQYNPNATGIYNVEDTNITSVTGLVSLLDLVVYGFTFGLVGLGIGLIVIGIKK